MTTPSDSSPRSGKVAKPTVTVPVSAQWAGCKKPKKEATSPHHRRQAQPQPQPHGQEEPAMTSPHSSNNSNSLVPAQARVPESGTGDQETCITQPADTCSPPTKIALDDGNAREGGEEEDNALEGEKAKQTPGDDPFEGVYSALAVTVVPASSTRSTSSSFSSSSWSMVESVEGTSSPLVFQPCPGERHAARTDGIVTSVTETSSNAGLPRAGKQPPLSSSPKSRSSETRRPISLPEGLAQLPRIATKTVAELDEDEDLGSEDEEQVCHSEDCDFDTSAVSEADPPTFQLQDGPDSVAPGMSLTKDHVEDSSDADDQGAGEVSGKAHVHEQPSNTSGQVPVDADDQPRHPSPVKPHLASELFFFHGPDADAARNPSCAPAAGSREATDSYHILEDYEEGDDEYQDNTPVVVLPTAPPTLDELFLGNHRLTVLQGSFFNVNLDIPPWEAAAAGAARVPPHLERRASWRRKLTPPYSAGLVGLGFSIAAGAGGLGATSESEEDGTDGESASDGGDIVDDNDDDNDLEEPQEDGEDEEGQGQDGGDVEDCRSEDEFECCEEGETQEDPCGTYEVNILSIAADPGQLLLLDDLFLAPQGSGDTASAPESLEPDNEPAATEEHDPGEALFLSLLSDADRAEQRYWKLAYPDRVVPPKPMRPGDGDAEFSNLNPYLTALAARPEWDEPWDESRAAKDEGDASDAGIPPCTSAEDLSPRLGTTRARDLCAAAEHGDEGASVWYKWAPVTPDDDEEDRQQADLGGFLHVEDIILSSEEDHDAAYDSAEGEGEMVLALAELIEEFESCKDWEEDEVADESVGPEKDGSGLKE